MTKKKKSPRYQPTHRSPAWGGGEANRSARHRSGGSRGLTAALDAHRTGLAQGLRGLQGPAHPVASVRYSRHP